jgi:hypothetical protein
MTTYSANNIVPMDALPTTVGVAQTFRAAETNDGPSTYAPDGLTAAPIFGLGGQQLQGNEIISGGIATLVSSVEPVLNHGQLCWILVGCAGGALPVAAATQSLQAVQLQQVGHGQCRLSVTDSTTLTLRPYNGNNVLVDGVPLQLPSLGVAIDNAGLAASTVYYVYLAGNTASPSLVLSTIVHVSAPSGVEVMNDDVTKTLVGMIATNSSGQFVDSPMQRFCLNWFNRRNLSCVAFSAPSFTFSNTVSADINPSLDLEWLTWGDESTFASVGGNMITNSLVGSSTAFQLVVDGVAAGPGVGVLSTGSPYYSLTTQQFSEGAHRTNIVGNVTGGTASVNCQTDTMIRG